MERGGSNILIDLLTCHDAARDYALAMFGEHVDDLARITNGHLHQVPDHSPTDALIVHLPPFPRGKDSLAHSVPEFLKEWPVASINYRWGPSSIAGPRCKEGQAANQFRWPVPVHDTAIAFQWITEHLISWDSCKANILIYGSYLGATLATSLSLTESRPHDRFKLRGLAAFNGIYNWTMFLPDYKVNLEDKSSQSANTTRAIDLLALLQSMQMDNFRMRMKALFDNPSNLFDPFASPSLFFVNPGLLIPRLFHVTAMEAAIIHASTGYDKLFIKATKPPPKSFVDFPPRDSELRIPDSLLMHGIQDAKITSCCEILHDYRVQAEELVSLMRRSIRLRKAEEEHGQEGNTEVRAEERWGRVQAADVGAGIGVGLSRRGQDVLTNWLRRRL